MAKVLLNKCLLVESQPVKLLVTGAGSNPTEPTYHFQAFWELAEALNPIEGDAIELKRTGQCRVFVWKGAPTVKPTLDGPGLEDESIQWDLDGGSATVNENVGEEDPWPELKKKL